MNNKYLSGLLAGVLTAGVLQGSGGKANMPGLGGNQTPVIRAQSANELPEELQELFLAFSQSLAERGYQAQINVNPIQMPNQITRITFNEHGGMQSNEGAFDLPEMVLSESESLSTPVELTHLTIGENGETRQKVVTGKKQLDPFHMHTVQQYMGYVKKSDDKPGSSEDLKNLIQVNKNFEDQPERNRINVFPITKDNKGLYPKIQTQQIFGPSDYILPRMYQYIITYPVTKAEIESWVARLGNMHNGEAIKGKNKPIVFKYQLLPDFWDTDPQGEIMTEGPNAVFKIEKYYIDTDTWQWTLEGYDNRHHLRNLGKPIVFKEIVVRADRTDVYLKDILEPAGAKALLYKIESYIDYKLYCKLVQKYPAIDNPNLVFSSVRISGESAEEQREQLKVLSMDKRVFGVSLDYQGQNLIFLELLSNVKISYANPIDIDNPNLFQKPRSITFFHLFPGTQIGDRKIYSFHGFKYDNDILFKKVKEYVQYVKDNNLEYISSFVNFAKKPSYLTDEEWRKVLVLTGRVEELMDFVDQKFNEYEEANPYVAPAADPYGCGDNYGCDGGRAGYNPYGEYYYNYGYSC